MSELHDLPDGWKWEKLDKLTDVNLGKTPTRSNKNFFLGDKVWLSIRDLKGNSVSESKEMITDEAIKDCNIKIVPKGTLLMSFKLTLGRTAFTNCDLYTNEAIVSLPIKDESILDKFFLNYSIGVINLEKEVDNAVKGKTLNKVKIRNLDIPLPPLSEQKRIVSKLDLLFEKIDKSIALHVKNMNEADVFMGSVLNDVFGELEEKYKKKQLHTVIKIIGGGTPSKSENAYWDNGSIKWATVGDMNVETIVDTALSITDIGLKNSSSNLIPKEAIIIATRVGLGKVCYLDSDTAINQDLKGLLPLNDGLNIRFLFNYFKNIKEYIISNGTGATVKGVKLDFIKSIEIPIPSIQTQQKVVKYLDDISKKIEKVKSVQKEKMDSLKSLKASILDRAFRGEL